MSLNYGLVVLQEVVDADALHILTAHGRDVGAGLRYACGGAPTRRYSFTPQRPAKARLVHAELWDDSQRRTETVLG